MKTAIVVPTCRPDRYEAFRAAWAGYVPADAEWIVVQDAKAATINGAYDWQSIDDRLGEQSWIISRQDSAVRSFGFLIAWERGCEFVVTIDDDCLPGDRMSNLVGQHLAAMQVKRFISTIGDLRVRGLPYEPMAVNGLESKVNVGVWSNVFDFDAITQLTHQAQQSVFCRAVTKSAAVAPGQYIPMCGMNLAFHRDAIPLMHFGLQGAGQPVGRFDDIWCGVLAKRISDHLGWAWTFGAPTIEHSRASDPYRNLIKEAPGVAEHEHYWRHLAETPLTEKTAVGCMAEAADHIRSYSPKYLPAAYFVQLGNAVEVWARIIKG